MARLSCEKRAELESFWRSHHDEWEHSSLNQREYCEVHGLPLKRFGNWRAKFKTETAAVQGKLLYRRGGRLRHMASHMFNNEIVSTSTGYVPSVKSMPDREFIGHDWFEFLNKNNIAVAIRIKNGDWLIITSNREPKNALRQYRKRWAIECMFGDTKTRGFNIEDISWNGSRVARPGVLSSPCHHGR